MTPVFLDTVGLLALWDESDQWHAAAEDAFSQLLTRRVKLLTSSFVLLETGNAASRRPYRNAVADLQSELRRCGQIVFPTDGDWQEGWEAYRTASANRAGIVDQISFAIMRRLRLTQAFTNDQHFRAAGFETLF